MCTVKRVPSATDREVNATGIATIEIKEKETLTKEVLLPALAARCRHGTSLDLHGEALPT